MRFGSIQSMIKSPQPFDWSIGSTSRYHREFKLFDEHRDLMTKMDLRLKFNDKLDVTSMLNLF
jgi:hypothetical protein